MKNPNQPSKLISDMRPHKQDKPKINAFRKFTKKRNYVFLVVIVIVIAGFVAGYLVFGKNASLGQKELDAAKANVSQLILLPTDEEPTLAEVTDKALVKDPFLANKSENGDQVLVFTKNKLVIIYRPSINKIVTVGSVTTDPAIVEAQGITLTILNGIGDETKTQKIINDIKKSYPDIKITNGGKSNKQDFPYTIVIDGTNQKDSLVDSLVTITSGKHGVQPLSEGKASTDFLIIVGKD